MSKRRTYQKRARRGRNAPGPYTKRNKSPHVYSAAYYDRRRSISRSAKTAEQEAADHHKRQAERRRERKLG
jgi:hypothetical protein